MDASRIVTAFQRAVAEATATDVGRGGTGGSGFDELLRDDSISHSFQGNALENVIAACNSFLRMRWSRCTRGNKNAMTFEMTATPP